MYDVEDIYIDENDKKKYNNKNFELEDIDMNKSFGENVHYIFFRIFRYQLGVIQNNYVKNKVFDIQIFLDDYCQDEMRDFWDKLASTVAFDNFLMNLNNTNNDLTSKICLNILSLEKEENDNINNSMNNSKGNYYSKNYTEEKNKKILEITYNLPLNINYILNQFIEIDDENDDYGIALNKLKIDYCFTLTKIRKYREYSNNKQSKKFENDYQKKSMKIRNKSTFFENFNAKHKNNNDIIFEKRLKKKVPSILNLQSENISLSSRNGINGEIIRNSVRKEDRRPSSKVIFHKTNKNLFYLYGLDTIKSIEEKIIKNQIRKLNDIHESKQEISFDSENNELLYHQDFLSFSKFFFVTLTLKKNISLGYMNIFIKRIKTLLTNDYCVIDQENKDSKEDNNNSDSNSNSDDSKDDENKNNKDKNRLLNLSEDSEDKLYSSRDSSSDLAKNKDSSDHSNENLEKKPLKKDNNIIIRNNQFNRTKCIKSTGVYEYIDLIKINSNELTQFFIFAAYILELDNIAGVNQHIFTILKLYEKSFIDNDKEFPFNNFYNFLDTIDYIMLHNYFLKINENKEYDDKKKVNAFLNIIALKLTDLDGKENGVRRKIRTFKSTKNITLQDFIRCSDTAHRLSKNDISLSNKAVLQFKITLLQDEKNNLNISLVNNFLKRQNTDKEGNNQLKINVLNLYKKYKKTTKDPLQLIEEIAVHIYLFILKKSLHKIQPEIITPKLLLSLQNSVEFQPIKDLVAELQVIDLKYLLKISDEHKTTFWLNVFNFLMVFAVIYRKENLLTYYEWHKLKKNSYFNIGNINFSLYEIETNILRNNYMSKKLFSEIIDFPKGDSRNKFKIDSMIKYMNFAISEPMTSSFKLQIYFPQTIEKQILKNAIDYFNSRIIVDGKNILVKIPEYLSWVDDNFLGNLNYYKEIMNSDVFDFIKKNQDKVTFIKHDWSLNFSDSIV